MSVGISVPICGKTSGERVFNAELLFGREQGMNFREDLP